MKRRFTHRILTSKLWLPILAGGMAMQFNLSGCDQDVRDTFLTGVATSLTSLVTAVINTFFLSLQDAGSSTSQPVVQLMHSLPNWLA
jgi:hypothetical protein